MKLLKDIYQINGWKQVLTRSIDKILLILAVCSVPAALASLSRATLAGFQPSMALHITISLSLIYFAIRYRQYSLTFKLHYLLVLSLLISTFGIYNWGLVGNGILWSILGIIFITLYYGIRLGILSAILFCIYTSLVGYLYISGNLQPVVEPNLYATSVTGWITAVLGALLPLALTVLVIGTLYDTARDMLQKLEKQRVEITVLAEQDSLTGLYNTRVFQQLIEQAIERCKRHDSWLYLVNIDLDSFKKVNDNYGHHAGDTILKYVAKQLMKVTRVEDTLCRVGGDEFLLLIEQPRRYTSQELELLIERLKQVIAEPCQYDDITLEISGSVGYAAYNAHHTPKLTSKDDILKEADRNMFKDKNESRARQSSQAR